MRIVLWLLVLVTVCAALLLWNQRITTEARAERDALRQGSAPSSASTDDAADGFGHVLVGEKSGAPILEPDPSLAPPPGVPPVTDPRNARKNAPQNSASSDDAQHETQYVVAAGESLSTICQRHYALRDRTWSPRWRAPTSSRKPIRSARG